MASGIAHEINNPLHIIKGNCELLEILLEESSPDIAGVREAVRLIDTMGSRIANIVGGLRALARDQRNDPMIEVSVKQILSDTLALCEQRIRNRGIELQLPEVSESITLSCHPTQISQVLLNLLNNATDAVSDLENRWIRVEVSEDGEQYVVFTVTDSGSRLPKDEAEKIFEPFYTRKPVGKGTGLGLSISRSIIEAHRGVIYVDSTAANTCFTVRVPRNEQPPEKPGNSST